MTNQPNNQSTFNEENFEELFQESIQGVDSFNDQLVKGKVVDIVNDYVIVDVGLKSEGRIHIGEFTDDEGNKVDVNVGDLIEIFVDKYEDKDGLIILSKEKAKREEAWYKLEVLCKEGTPVEGLVTKRVKGGFMVLVKNVTAFLPGSQLDLRPMKNINALVGTKQMFKILATDRKRYNIVLSRKAIIEQNMKENGIVPGANFKEGETVEGTVKNITGYGAFIDLGTIDGLLHVTDISWSRVNHPSEVLKVGQNIEVKIIKIHPETGRISLGVKQLTEDPWVAIDKKYNVGSKFKVAVTNITDYGVFVEIEKGVEGLVHVSELSWGKSSEHPSVSYKTGDIVDAVILDIDVKKRRISLSIKQCQDNPWMDYLGKNPVDSVVEGTIKSVEDNGIVVSLEGEIEGFVRLSDIAWGNSNPELLTPFKDKVNEKVQVKIIKADIDREKISLGIKQLEEDPFLDSIKEYSKGSTVKAKVVEVKDSGLNVEIKEGLVGFIKKSDLSLDKDNQKTSSYNVGDEVEAIIIGIDERDRTFNLSIKAIEQVDQKKYLNNQESSSDNLADMLNEALNKNKE